MSVEHIESFYCVASIFVFDILSFRNYSQQLYDCIIQRTIVLCPKEIFVN